MAGISVDFQNLGGTDATHHLVEFHSGNHLLILKLVFIPESRPKCKDRLGRVSGQRTRGTCRMHHDANFTFFIDGAVGSPGVPVEYFICIIASGSLAGLAALSLGTLEAKFQGFGTLGGFRKALDAFFLRRVAASFVEFLHWKGRTLGDVLTQVFLGEGDILDNGEVCYLLGTRVFVFVEHGCRVETEVTSTKCVRAWCRRSCGCGCRFRCGNRY
mmetsp:Transcript_18034/g.34176  ORF Transcript_18034/g.34176 Transcript_18034/m.34176 type:complete len:215 (+) Transcript_18034:933-1577(+)